MLSRALLIKVRRTSVPVNALTEGIGCAWCWLVWKKVIRRKVFVLWWVGFGVDVRVNDVRLEGRCGVYHWILQQLLLSAVPWGSIRRVQTGIFLKKRKKTTKILTPRELFLLMYSFLCVWF